MKQLGYGWDMLNHVISALPLEIFVWRFHFLKISYQFLSAQAALVWLFCACRANLIVIRT